MHTYTYFICAAACIAGLLALLPAAAETTKPVAREGSLLHNTFAKLTKEKRLKIVVIGNSVSFGSDFPGVGHVNYMTHVAQWFKQKFPDAVIDIDPSIIFAIGPETQLFRMEEKLVAKKPDLVITEFGAANGAWGDKGQAITERATEGYIRRLRYLLPQADCLMNMGLCQTMMADYTQGKTPLSVTFMRTVATHYGCALADSEKALAERVLAGEPWATYMKDGIHPGLKGYEVHGQVLAAELDRQYTRFTATPEAERAPRDHAFPRATVHPDPWLFPRLEPALFASDLQGFAPQEAGRVKFLAAERGGASGSFTATRGKIVGVLLRSPEKRGNLEVRLDGTGDWLRLSMKSEPRLQEEDDPGSRFQRYFFGGYNLPLYAHRVDFRVAATPEDPGVYTVQIVGFFVIERDAALDFTR